MRINSNVSALNAWRNLFMTDNSLGKNLERLSSGYRVNRAADDAAGLSISENMRAQIRGFNQAVRNAQDGISLVATAEGSLNEVHTILQRMRELSVQSANGTLQPEDRSRIQTEFDNLTMEITRITNSSKFNNKDLIDGSLKAANITDITLQIGPNAGQTVTFEVGGMDAASLGLGRSVLTGIVDDGTVYASATVDVTFTSVTSIDEIGYGISTAKSYQIVDSGTAFQLQASTDGGTTWVNVGGTVASNAAGIIALGDTATGEYLAINRTGTAAAGTSAVTFAGSLTNDIVSTIDEVGAGLEEGQYLVAYDASTQTVQLQDLLGNDIGQSAAFVAGGQVTIGDGNTARTVKLTLQTTAPAANNTDTITLASEVGQVTVDSEGYLNGTRAVLDVGHGLESGDYRISFQDGATDTVQLLAADGSPIGASVAYAPNTTLTLGDSVTGRTVTIQTGPNAVAANYDAMIRVVNNEKSAESAKFNGGVKTTDARAYAGINVSSQSGAMNALEVIDTAINGLSKLRSELGAIQNRLEHTINNLQVVSENLVAAESRIRDVDMALEMAQFTKNQILLQSGTAMLAQANTKNQAVLQLLNG